MCCREMIENGIGVKGKVGGGVEQSQLVDLLVMKDIELRELLSLASHQAAIDQRMELLRAEVDKLDQDIQLLQRQLKEAEHILVCIK